MIGRGRPLRFLGLVAIGWVGARVVLLWPQGGTLAEAIRASVPMARVERRDPPAAVPPVARMPVPAATAARVDRAPSLPPRPVSDPLRVELALLNLLHFGGPEYLDAPSPPAPAPGAAFAFQQRSFDAPPPGRWSASAWLAVRPGSGPSAAPDAGQLGGSQAGMRVAYALGSRRSVALYARVAAPLSGKGREAALGVEWQPSRMPFKLIAEERIGLDGTHAAPGAGVVAGLDRALPAGFRLEAYGQAGAVARRRVEPYADAAARATHPLARAGPLRLTLGLGAWGAAQRDAARLDLGPSAVLAMPLARRELRLALDWRQRVAGAARPGSGLAMTLGGDF